MNNNLTNQDIARVFAMYLGQKCIASDGGQIDLGGLVIYNILNIGYYNQKLLLRPLSAITDEDAIELLALVGCWKRFELKEFDREFIMSQVNLWVTMFLADFNGVYKGSSNKSSGADAVYGYSFLISKAYAVALFIAPNHPDNGKTAIQLGIAIDSTTLTP